jgi:hypothetical protein
MMLGLLTQLAATATFATPPHLRLAERPTWTLTGDGSPAVRVSNLSLPSLVQLDLHEAGLIGSPLHGNALDDGSLRWIHDAGRNWTYSTVFTAPVSVHGLLLVAQSLDTLATVRLNGAVVGTSTNMHVQLALELPATVLRPGTENVLAISFGDPVSYSIAQHAAHPCSSCKFNATQYPIYSWAQGRPWIRKTQSHYGWNWGPAGMPYGVPRDIFLVELSKLLLEDMRVSMMPAAARRADQLPLLPTERLEDNATDFEVTLELRVRSVLPAPAGTALLVTAGWDESGVPQTVHLPALPRGVSTVTVTLEAKRPALWWPRELLLAAGVARPTMYNLTVALPAAAAARERAGAKKDFFVKATVYGTQNDSFHQDRLGINIGKVEGRGCFLQGTSVSLVCTMSSAAAFGDASVSARPSWSVTQHTTAMAQSLPGGSMECCFTSVARTSFLSTSSRPSDRWDASSTRSRCARLRTRTCRWYAAVHHPLFSIGSCPCSWLEWRSCCCVSSRLLTMCGHARPVHTHRCVCGAVAAIWATISTMYIL